MRTRRPRSAAWFRRARKKHLQALNLDENASADEIKIQFKALVKLHHPDHNGGDRSSEDRFREVLAAYNYLKQAGPREMKLSGAPDQAKRKTEPPREFND